MHKQFQLFFFCIGWKPVSLFRRHTTRIRFYIFHIWHVYASWKCSMLCTFLMEYFTWPASISLTSEAFSRENINSESSFCLSLWCLCVFERWNWRTNNNYAQYCLCYLHEKVHWCTVQLDYGHMHCYTNMLICPWNYSKYTCIQSIQSVTAWTLQHSILIYCLIF